MSKGYSSIYLKIKKISDIKHIPISYIERQCGLSNGTIGKWKTKTPTSNNIAKVAKFLNTTVDWLISSEE